MKSRYLLLLIPLGIALALALGLALQGIARNTVVMPLLYIAWMLQLVFNSIPGWLWWAWFLIIAMVMAIRSLKGRSERTAGPSAGRLPAQGPVRGWAVALRAAAQGGSYFQWHLAHDLAELALQFTAYQDHRGAEQLERVEYLESLKAPPDVFAYLSAGLQPPPWQPVKVADRITRLWRQTREHTPLDLNPQQAIAFLEGQTERENDD